MTFSYLEINSQIARPIIPIVIRLSKTFILYAGLIDSGADCCIFSFEIAEKLRIDPKKRQQVKFFGVGQDEIDGFLGK